MNFFGFFSLLTAACDYTKFKRVHQQNLSNSIHASRCCSNWASRVSNIQSNTRIYWRRRIQKKRATHLKYYLPQVEAASFLSILLAFSWLKAVRLWTKFMVYFILWGSFAYSLAAGILLICFQKPTTDACGIALIAFSMGNGLYSCWVTQRTNFCTKILMKSLEPASKFPDINHPTYYMLIIGFLSMSLWIVAVIGSLNFVLTPLVITGLCLSLAWVTEVVRVVIALYYLRGIQSSKRFAFTGTY